MGAVMPKKLISRFVTLNLVRGDSGKIEKSDQFLDSRPAERVASDLNQLLDIVKAPYRYQVPSGMK